MLPAMLPAGNGSVAPPIRPPAIGWDSWTDAVSMGVACLVWLMVVFTLRQLKASLADRQQPCWSRSCGRLYAGAGTGLVLLPLYDGFLKLIGLECVFSLVTHTFDLVFDFVKHRLGPPGSTAFLAYTIPWAACTVASHAARALCSLTLLLFLSRDSAGRSALRGSIAVAVVWAIADAAIVAYAIAIQETPDLSSQPDLHDYVEGITMCVACLFVAAEECCAVRCRPRGRRSSRGAGRRRRAWMLVCGTLFLFSAVDVALIVATLFATSKDSLAVHLRWVWRMSLYLLEMPIFYVALRRDSLYWLRMGRSSGSLSWDDSTSWWDGEGGGAPSRMTSCLLRHVVDPRVIVKGQRIGTGGQAMVFQGWYQGRVVALKESIMADMCPESVDAIVAESEVLCRLSHTNIVRFFGVAFSPPNVVLVMPLLGPSLEETLARRHSSRARRQGSARRRGSMEAGPLGYTMLYYLAHDMASGMAYLHAQGIAHRDLKPANVLLTRPLDDSLTRPVNRLTRPRAMLCDFGISQWDGVLGAQLRNASRDDSMQGTFPYLPPESAQMKIGAIDATGAVVGGVAGVGGIGAAEIGSPPRFLPTKAVEQWRAEGDVWAAGVIVWQCATLCVPWAQCNNRHDFVREVNAIHPPRPGLVPPRLHGGFATLIEMCWEPDPIARPTSEDVKEFLETSSLLDNERREAMLMTPDRIPSVDPSVDAEMDGFSGLNRSIEAGMSGSGRGSGRGSGSGSDLSRQSSRVSFPPRRGHGGGSGGHVRLTASEWDMDSILDGKRDSVPPVMIPGALPARTQSESGEGLSASLLSFGT